MSDDLNGACCRFCEHWRGIPRKHGDCAYGYCTAHDEWFHGGDKVTETECDEFKWLRF